MDFNEVLELPADLFSAIYRAAIMYKLCQTEKGREYLEKAERLQNTELDISGFDAFKKAVYHD